MQAPGGEWWGLSQPAAGVSAELGRGSQPAQGRVATPFPAPAGEASLVVSAGRGCPETFAWALSRGLLVSRRVHGA